MKTVSELLPDQMIHSLGPMAFEFGPMPLDQFVELYTMRRCCGHPMEPKDSMMTTIASQIGLPTDESNLFMMPDMDVDPNWLPLKDRAPEPPAL